MVLLKSKKMYEKDMDYNGPMSVFRNGMGSKCKGRD